MPALVSVPPAILMQVLRRLGWIVYVEDSYNWLLVKEAEFIALPKRGRRVSMQILDTCIERAQMTPADYFDALEALGYKI